MLLPPNSYLLGDSAYPLREFIMVPFRDNGHLTPNQRKFNKRLSSSRVVIEQAFGRLKGLFRRLKYLNAVRLQYTKYIILTCCILHNVSLRDGIVCEEIDECCFDDFENGPENGNLEPVGAVQLRNTIMSTLV